MIRSQIDDGDAIAASVGHVELPAIRADGNPPRVFSHCYGRSNRELLRAERGGQPDHHARDQNEQTVENDGFLNPHTSSNHTSKPWKNQGTSKLLRLGFGRVFSFRQSRIGAAAASAVAGRLFIFIPFRLTGCPCLGRQNRSLEETAAWPIRFEELRDGFLIPHVREADAGVHERAQRSSGR